ncbi:MAG TPA: MFS transporter, partial [Quisquiliibacterium sp.]|nr:MFS transporter [Quisquiliibacterium sp.]
MTSPRLPPTLVVYLAGLAAAVNVGKLPPALPALQAGLGVSLVQSGLLVSAFQVGGMCLGLFGGLLADRFGLRRSMGCGLALLAVAGGAGALAGDVLLLMTLRAVESAGFVLCVLPGPALLRRVTPLPRMNVALGVWGSYMPAGMAAALVLAPWLIETGGWRLAWWWASAFSAAVCVLVFTQLPPDASRGAQPQRLGALARQTVASR